MATERIFRIYVDERETDEPPRRIDVAFGHSLANGAGVRLAIAELDGPNSLPESETSTETWLAVDEARELIAALSDVVGQIESGGA